MDTAVSASSLSLATKMLSTILYSALMVMDRIAGHAIPSSSGLIQNAFAAYHKQHAKSDIMPLSMCVAMSQGYIGYDLQNMIGEELDRRGLGTAVRRWRVPS